MADQSNSVGIRNQVLSKFPQQLDPDAIKLVPDDQLQRVLDGSTSLRGLRVIVGHLRNKNGLKAKAKAKVNTRKAATKAAGTAMKALIKKTTKKAAKLASKPNSISSDVISAESLENLINNASPADVVKAKKLLGKISKLKLNGGPLKVNISYPASTRPAEPEISQQQLEAKQHRLAEFTTLKRSMYAHLDNAVQALEADDTAAAAACMGDVSLLADMAFRMLRGR